MPKIGILAYGSLIDNPGPEIEPHIADRLPDVQTPFSIEFARSSDGRNGAPTLVPVTDGGSPVSATVLVLTEEISLKAAQDMLWRRETCNVGSERPYQPPANPTENTVLIDQFNNLDEVDVLLSTRIGSNIPELSARRLAELAIESARAKAETEGRDGISYLLSAKSNGLSTPLMADYEAEILAITEAPTLEEALAICKDEGV